jgi:hypothetical protein
MTAADFLNKQLVEVNVRVELATIAFSCIFISNIHNALQSYSFRVSEPFLR